MQRSLGNKELSTMGNVFIDDIKALNRLDSLFSRLSSEYDMDYRAVAKILKKRQDYVAIPASIFNNQLSPLENVVLYLSLKFSFSQTQIAGMLRRDHTTIWTTYIISTD